MNTSPAIAERTEEALLREEIQAVSDSPVVSGLLHAVGGLLAILDEHLQIVALNETFLNLLCIEHPRDALGLRLGEVMQCVNASVDPAGCGTSKVCSSCGAAIAIVSSLGQDKPVERVCAMRVNRGGRWVDLALRVRSHIIQISKRRFLLVFIQDITQQEQWAALERTFFHDVNNMLSLLTNASDLLIEESKSDLAQVIHEAVQRLAKEVSIQRCLLEDEMSAIQPNMNAIAAGQALKELSAYFANHPSAQGKVLHIDDTDAGLQLTTDSALLHRVLRNMVMNALEATEPQGVVRVWLEREGGLLSFCVWNAQVIPENIAPRIFQRTFSTKQQAGRGIGTYVMKLFGEKFLGGRVTFVSAPEIGTIFRISLPR